MTEKDRNIVRSLAGELAELAALPIQAERIRMWKNSNGLRPNRPMIYMAAAEMPWGEITPHVDDLQCRCENPALRRIEYDMRRKLFIAKHLETDHVVEDTYWIEKKIDGDGFGLDVQEQLIERADSSVASHHYEPVICDMDDIEKIRTPEIVYDEVRTRERAEFIDDLLGDILPVKICGKRTHTYNAWDTAVCWTGVTETLMDLLMRPDFCHAVMRRLTDAVLSRMDQMEALGLLDHPNPRHTVGSGAAGYTDELPQADCDGERYRHKDIWGSSTSQIFSDVSPEMHEEFAVKYEVETLRRCGLTYYGCCEPLHNKMHILAGIPNLRKISISPWCDTTKAVENAARKYVFSHKPSPSVFAAESFSIEEAEADVRRRLECSRGMSCEVIAKDITTCRGEVERLINWTRMAMRVAREFEPGSGT